MSTAEQSHARRNALTGEWVLVSPNRLQRPWQGQVESIEDEGLLKYDPDCYLCPGNKRANGNANPSYAGPYSFDNDFPALSPASEVAEQSSPFFKVRGEAGVCRVICYTERHDLRLATMDEEQLAIAITAMIDQFRELDAREDIGYVQLFENRGEMMGCSNPHPHAQVWATAHVPSEPAKETQAQLAYFKEHGSSLLLDYLDAEITNGERIVLANEHFVALVPFWAVWPFETMLAPRRAVAAPDELDAAEIAGLAAALQAVLAAYDRMFSCSTPYSMGFHARPSDGAPHPEWQFHIHIYPPLLRSATVRKHLVGFEMLGMPQRDLTPEVAAERLRSSLP